MLSKLILTLRKALGLQPFSYYYNDPTTPDLFAPTAVPRLLYPNPQFTVVGWNGQVGTVPGTPEFQATQVYVTITNAMNLLQSIYARQLLTKWSVVNNLVAIPRAGQQLNAFYDRGTLRFFYGPNASGKMVYSSESVDVVAHELGHAVLDALRPDLWNTASLEVFAFHEAFGDILAIATVLSSDQVVNKVLAETGSDLHKPNVASKIAEEMGRAIYDLSGGRSGAIDNLRNAANNLLYETPENLPKGGNSQGLMNQPHNFSRVFTGAWYECLAQMVQFFIHETKTQPVHAVKLASMNLLRGVIHAARSAPSTMRFFSSIADAMVGYFANYPKFKEIVERVFHDRNIRKYTSSPMNKANLALPTNLIDSSVEGSKMRLNIADDHIVVELPHFGITGEKGEVTSHSAAKCLSFLESHDMLGTSCDEYKMFGIVDGKLERNYICQLQDRLLIK